MRDYQSSDPKALPLTHPKMGAKIAHPVMMVGDGLNDGPALALAAVGVSFSSPCKAVSEKAADIIITDPNRGLFLLGQIALLGSRVRNVVRENLTIALFTKALVVIVGAAGYIPLWVSVVSDGLCLLLVMANGARPLSWRPNNTAIMDKFAEEATAVRSSAVAKSPTRKTLHSPRYEKPDFTSVQMCKKQCCNSSKKTPSTDACKARCCSGQKRTVPSGMRQPEPTNWDRGVEEKSGRSSCIVQLPDSAAELATESCCCVDAQAGSR